VGLAPRDGRRLRTELLVQTAPGGAGAGGQEFQGTAEPGRLEDRHPGAVSIQDIKPPLQDSGYDVLCIMHVRLARLSHSDTQAFIDH
jgi:hypothetical protein